MNANRYGSQSFTTSRLTRRQALGRGAAGLTAGALLASGLSRSAHAQTPTAGIKANDFAGLVDVGKRNIFLEAHGSGGPTVVFVSGYRTSGRYWTDDLIHPKAPREMVMAGVSAFTHAAAYDRPGTYAEIGDDILPSRSDAIPQPRTAAEVVAELHDLLKAAAVAGPYVLAAHSLGGLFARLYLCQHLPRRRRRYDPRGRLLRAAGDASLARSI